MTLGEKIQSLRKQRELSQEALAEMVGVTRQTVSKWECSQSTPDLDFIAQLSGIFQVSSDYLIKDEMTEPDKPPFQKKARHLSERAKRRMLAAVTAAALIAAYVCLICDYFTAETLSWSLIVVVSIAAAWLLVLPILTARTAIIRRTLLTASLIPVPMLAILALLLKEWTVCQMGSCISLAAIAAAWSIYGIFCKCRERLWRALGFSLLVLLPVPIVITQITAWFLPEYPFDPASALFNSGITLVLALAAFGVDRLSPRKTREVRGR